MLLLPATKFVCIAVVDKTLLIRCNCYKIIFEHSIRKYWELPVFQFESTSSVLNFSNSFFFKIQMDCILYKGLYCIYLAINVYMRKAHGRNWVPSRSCFEMWIDVMTSL